MHSLFYYSVCMKSGAKETLLAVKAAFPLTIPVLTGYIFLGMAFGIMLSSKGYGIPWALLMSVIIFAGSGQFVGVALLASGFDPIHTILVTLMVNARHVFYGLSMLEKFRPLGKAKLYLIFGLTDETYSLLCTAVPPKEVDPKRFYLSIAALDHLYWISGSLLGNLIGTAFTFNTTGVDFVMTALFVVIFLEQWNTNKGRISALMGVGIAVICLLIFGSQWFLIPTMILLAIVLMLTRSSLEERIGL